MKPRPIILTFLGLSAIGAIAWLSHSPAPGIRFVEFRNIQGSREAVFHVVNESAAPFSFLGYDSSSPLYHYRISTGSGWEPRFNCGFGVGAHTIAPHRTMEIQVPVPPDSPSAFAVGIHFEQGAAEQFKPRERGSILGFFYALRYRVDPNYEGPEPTWSTVAQAK